MIDGKEPEVPWEDPIVAEVRAVRAALLAAAGGNLDELGRRLRQEQATSGHEVMTLSPRPPGRSSGEAA